MIILEVTEDQEIVIVGRLFYQTIWVSRNASCFVGEPPRPVPPMPHCGSGHEGDLLVKSSPTRGLSASFEGDCGSASVRFRRASDASELLFVLVLR